MNWKKMKTLMNESVTPEFLIHAEMEYGEKNE
jgi:hypothetical protein